MIPFLSDFPFEALSTIFNKRNFDFLAKTGEDFATSSDIASEALLLSLIHKHYPQDSVLSEESLEKRQRPLDSHFTVDPLDGTYNYALGLPYYGLQLERTVNGSSQFAMIWLPSLNLICCAESGKLSLFALDARYQLTEFIKPKKAHGMNTISFGDFSKSNVSSQGFQSRLMASCAKSFSKVRIHGASSVDFALLAAGLTDVHVTFTKRPWELKPGLTCAVAAGLSYEAMSIQVEDFKGICHITGTASGVNTVKDLCQSLF